jgi:plastocyanin
MGKRLAFVFLGLSLVATACGGIKGPQTYEIQIDQASPAGKKIQFSQFFPGAITAAPGDTLVFVNKSSEAPHTVTFGVKADRSNQPPLFGPTGENPAAFEPCYDPKGSSAKMTACADKKLPAAFDGKGYYNSGLKNPGPQSIVRVKLADDIADGKYTFVCVLHQAMNAILTVGGERESVDDVKDEGEEAADQAKDDAAGIKPPAPERGDKTATVSAGWGTPAISYNEFSPKEMTVDNGTTVTWSFKHPEEPHTITFESPFKQPADPRSFAPGGVKSGSDYAGGFANSGLISRRDPAFKLRFTKAGTYKYACTIHPGMEGTIKVS